MKKVAIAMRIYFDIFKFPNFINTVQNDHYDNALRKAGYSSALYHPRISYEHESDPPRHSMEEHDFILFCLTWS